MIEEFEILEEKKSTFIKRKEIAFRFKFKDDENWRYSKYAIFLENELNIGKYYKISEQSMLKAFTKEEEQEIVKAILNLKQHRLRHLTNPYKIK